MEASPFPLSPRPKRSEVEGSAVPQTPPGNVFSLSHATTLQDKASPRSCLRGRWFVGHFRATYPCSFALEPLGILELPSNALLLSVPMHRAAGDTYLASRHDFEFRPGSE